MRRTLSNNYIVYTLCVYKCKIIYARKIGEPEADAIREQQLKQAEVGLLARLGLVTQDISLASPD